MRAAQSLEDWELVNSQNRRAQGRSNRHAASNNQSHWQPPRNVDENAYAYKGYSRQRYHPPSGGQDALGQTQRPPFAPRYQYNQQHTNPQHQKAPLHSTTDPIDELTNKMRNLHLNYGEWHPDEYMRRRHRNRCHPPARPYLPNMRVCMRETICSSDNDCSDDEDLPAEMLYHGDCLIKRPAEDDYHRSTPHKRTAIKTNPHPTNPSTKPPPPPPRDPEHQPSTSRGPPTRLPPSREAIDPQNHKQSTTNKLPTPPAPAPSKPETHRPRPDPRSVTPCT